jgi:two-component system, OmpR family, sensor kinase
MTFGIISRMDRVSIRWRLALTSAAMTLAILLLFAAVIAVLAGRQLRSSFDDDLRLAAVDLQDRIHVRPTLNGLQLEAEAREVRAAATGGAVIRVVTHDGAVLAATEGAPDLGKPSGDTRDAGPYRVVSRPIGTQGHPLAFVQYAKPRASLNHTIARMRLFLGVGVIGGTLLALLAGLAVARRAMRPIAALTGAAKGVTRTRDPATRLPQPRADDEVADLARTLEEMLRALDESRSETEAALARQREFVADASHELRTPLTSILANLELLEADLEGEDAEIAGSALRSSHRMRRLVADLLLLARADAGRRAPRRATDMADVVREAVAEVAPVVDDHDVSVAIDADSGSLAVQGTPDDLHRLVLNLVENAVSHTPAGTSVHAELRRVGDRVMLEVSDDGPGVPAVMRERLFERFVRGSSTGERDAPGSGLGLAIVRAVAETHGGSVVLAESESTGARFVVTLPAAPAAAEDGKPPKPASEISPPRERAAKR